MHRERADYRSTTHLAGYYLSATNSQPSESIPRKVWPSWSIMAWADVVLSSLHWLTTVTIPFRPIDRRVLDSSPKLLVMVARITVLPICPTIICARISRPLQIVRMFQEPANLKTSQAIPSLSRFKSLGSNGPSSWKFHWASSQFKNSPQFRSWADAVPENRKITAVKIVINFILVNELLCWLCLGRLFYIETTRLATGYAMVSLFWRR